jgi:hypothetical protein
MQTSASCAATSHSKFNMNKLFRLLTAKADDIFLPMLIVFLLMCWFALALIFVTSVCASAKHSRCHPMPDDSRRGLGGRGEVALVFDNA